MSNVSFDNVNEKESMDKILIVGDYNRQDFLFVAKQLHKYFQFYFLEFFDSSEIENKNYEQWGESIFWKDFHDAMDLLTRIQPQKVLFYFVESYNHVALILACKCRGVPTFHLEHGIRYYPYFSQVSQDNSTNEVLKRKALRKRLLSFGNPAILSKKIQNRFFFLNTIRKLPPELAQFLRKYYRIRRKNSVFDTFRKLQHPLRTPDCYISFSQKTFEFHKLCDFLPDKHPVHYVGCPMFDEYYSLTKISNSGSDMLFIDQPFVEQSYFGWTWQYKEEFLQHLVDLARTFKKRLCIKSHPYSQTGFYEPLKKVDFVRVLENERDLIEIIGTIQVVIGFYSTLLMPLIALPFTTCFSLEIHPEAIHDTLSNFFGDSGAIKTIHNWEELNQSMVTLESIHSQQLHNKPKFIKEWMYKFDGKSTERLQKVLVQDEPAGHPLIHR